MSTYFLYTLIFALLALVGLVYEALATMFAPWEE